MAEHKACCDKGYDWAGTPVGKTVKLAGLSTYISEPAKKTDTAILVITDIWGWELKNTRLTADKLAAAGFLAVVPDLLHGMPYEKPFGQVDMDSFGKWLGKHPNDRVNKDIDQVLADLTNDYGIQKVGALGFCWGGQFAAHLAAQEKVGAASIPHGSFLTPELLESVKKPILLLCSGNDFIMSKEQREQFKAILDKKSFAHDVVTYEGMEHGFSLRGNNQDTKIAKAAADAFDRSRDFFKANLKTKQPIPIAGVLVWLAAAGLVVAKIVQEHQK